jgi:NitT/TauT family transport system ATP-binding protein
VNRALTLNDVGKRWPNGEMALEDIDLTVASGEFVSIVGPSGCGKSTLLRIIAGLETPSSGDVSVEAQTTEFVFQDPTLLPWLTVLENVSLPLELAGKRNEDVARSSLAEVGLSADTDKLPRELSGGMKMRTSVARALVTRPDLFLFDEPFSAVDELRREDLNRMLLALHEQRRFACVLVTHSVNEAVLLGDRVVVMSAQPGRIAADLPITIPRSERFERRFDADFIALTRAVSMELRGSPA